MPLEILIPDGWQQGRGAFGGLVISTLARQMETAEAAPERTLRSLTATLCGPVLAGPAEIGLELLRRGTGVSTWAARLRQGGEIQAHAVAAFGKQRVEDGEWNDVARPSLVPWQQVEVVEIGPPFGPAFATHFVFRPTGPLPFSASAATEVSGWLLPREPAHKRDAIYLAMMIDAYWPAAFTRSSAPRPMATLSYLLQVLDDDVPDTPLFHRASAAVARDGYTVEHRELWSEDGRLLAVNDQSIVIIR